jgi:hypothetical protein
MALVATRPRNLDVELRVHRSRLCETRGTATIVIFGDFNYGKEHELFLQLRKISLIVGTLLRVKSRAREVLQDVMLLFLCGK